jgi:hypothetical protein
MILPTKQWKKQDSGEYQASDGRYSSEALIRVSSDDLPELLRLVELGMKADEKIKKRSEITDASKWKYDPIKIENDVDKKPLPKNIKAVVDAQKF